ncbi:MAG TPA: FlgD immunoglobulin-like domain containing protein [Candidatus Krumholzibacteria bacterium]|nr:FlgD immunoglobulin-like domain containing protein [Candidatus Krumholzibacteria bacterium]
MDPLKWIRLSALFFSLSLFLTSFAVDADARPGPRDRDPATYDLVVPGPGTILTSTTTAGALLRRESAGPDTFDLYGGPTRPLRDPDGVPGSGDEYVEGRFESLAGLPAGLSPGPGDWTGVDRTDVANHWHVSTFRAANLGGHGAGNRAMWAGLPAGTPTTAGWAAAPGYGNDWVEVLLYESDPVVDRQQGQTVDLDFVFNHDTEPSYDFFRVEYERAGSWVTVFSVDGTNKDPGTGEFPVPGVQYASTTADPIVHSGDDYGQGDRIRIRLVFESDTAYSDQDGLFDGDGAVQLDDVVLTTDQGTFIEDFEGDGPYLFEPAPAPICGDFSNVFVRATDIDPCAENATPQLNFIDFGQAPPNGPGITGDVSTGGSLSPNWDYGIPGGYVKNYTGGLDGVPLHNEVWSPELAWDLPGPQDDGPDMVGARLEYSSFWHRSTRSFMVETWAVRAFRDGAWGPWVDSNFVFFVPGGRYDRFRHDLTALLPPDPEKIQVALGVIDVADDFGLPGDDATPAPFYDDVRISKYRIGGIALWARTVDLANDAFPVSGSIDVSTAAARDALDVRFDMARDVGSGSTVVPGDSVLFRANPVIPGTAIADLRLKWALRLNPAFEADLRQPPARDVDENVTTGTIVDGVEIWTGEVVADSARTASGVAIDDVFFADLPDEDFLYPGDVLHYHFEAVDSDGRVTTLPTDTAGFGQWDAVGVSGYARTFTVRALPTITGAQGSQPSILVVNDFGRRGNEEELVFAFADLGLIEGLDWDSYTVQGASSGVSNGIGSAGADNALGDRRGHGATVAQLAGYETIVYLSGNLFTNLISDGSDDVGNDKSPDLAVLSGWKQLAGPRHTVYFGASLVTGLVNDSPVDGAAYVADVMGVRAEDNDVGPAIGGQSNPRVIPTGAAPAFDTSFLAYAGCRGFLDEIVPEAAGAFAAYGFVDPSSGTIVPGPAAGVVHDRTVGGDRKVDLTFPVGLSSIRDDLSRAVGASSTRARLLQDVLDHLGTPTTAVDAPALRSASLAVHPTPFNPSTQVVFVLPRAGVDATVEVFNVRGERVRVLHDGAAASAELRLDWNGRDDRGSAVASGVYLVKATTLGFADTRKAVLVK